jgi:hypothetical protein
MILFLILVFVIGLCLTVAWWTGETGERSGTFYAKDWLDFLLGTFWGFLIGIGIVLVTPLLVVSMILELLARERLVIGSDRLQIIRRLRGHDVVSLQIPFVNVTKCSFEKTANRIGIDLAALDDPATYKQDDLKGKKPLTDRHYVLEDNYQTRLVAIHEKLVERMGPRSSEGLTTPDSAGKGNIQDIRAEQPAGKSDIQDIRAEQPVWKVKIPAGQQEKARRRAVYDVLEQHHISYSQRSGAADAFHQGRDGEVVMRDLGTAKAILAALQALGIAAEVIEPGGSQSGTAEGS